VTKRTRCDFRALLPASTRVLAERYCVPMKLRAFGNTDLVVSEYGLGCARIGGIFQGDAQGFLRLFAAAHDRGINFFDTADMYSQGESEALLGRAFRKQRSRVIIASKAGYCLPSRRRFAARIKPLLRPLIRALKIRRDRLPAGARGALSQDFSPQYLRRAVEASLRRLRTDYLDLLQLHSVPLEVVLKGEWEHVLEDLKRSGKIRYYGLSVDSLDAGLAGLNYTGVSSFQCVLSLLEQGASRELIPYAQARGMGIIARETLANGLLVKQPHEIDLKSYCSSDAEIEKRTRQLEEFRDQAAGSGVALSTLALRYASQLTGVSVALIGARSVEQLQALLKPLAG
jgi:aryl-alcohol dehydrogenase-like predicted oxidoreductase